MWDGTWGTLETSGEQTFREPRFPSLGGQGLGTEQEVVLHSLQRYHIELGKELIMRAKCVGPSAFKHVYGTAAMIIITANDPSWACFHELWPNLHISFC